MIVICETCGHPMASGTSCTDEGALRWGGEGDILETVTWPCHDCGVLPGGLHHPGCAVATCRVCGEQYLGCIDGEHVAPDRPN
jgi:hypothetical protein